MRRALLLFCLTACGGAGGGDGGVDVDSAECKACASTLSTASAQCSATLDQCTNNTTLYTEGHSACFRAEGRCQEQALDTASSCHASCGDTEQAMVETCAGDCFVMRAACAETAVRRAGGCLDACTGVDCELCRARGTSDFDACNATAQSCADACVRQYRSR